jgi:hypothetical protein
MPDDIQLSALRLLGTSRCGDCLRAVSKFPHEFLSEGFRNAASMKGTHTATKKPIAPNPSAPKPKNTAITRNALLQAHVFSFKNLIRSESLIALVLEGPYID